MTRKERIAHILPALRVAIPAPETELVHANPWQLLVAVMLSAQCTDARVNQVTPALFERFPDPFSLARSHFDEVFPYIRSISYPANKSRHLLATAQILVEKFRGEVPRAFEDLLSLPGVGRKTANVLSAILYEEPRMAVDTHVFRVANRLGIAKGKTPLAVESQLVALIPKTDIPDAHHLLILHGRYLCTARNPSCGACTVQAWCADFSLRWKKEKRSQSKGKSTKGKAGAG